MERLSLTAEEIAAAVLIGGVVLLLGLVTGMVGRRTERDREEWQKYLADVDGPEAITHTEDTRP